MATCRDCHGELGDGACLACEPPVELAAIAAIRDTERWRAAQDHRVPRRQVPAMAIGGVGLGAIGLALLGWAPRGAIVMAVLFVALAAIVLVGAIRQATRGLERWPAVVVTITATEIRGKHGTTTHYAVHLRDQDGLTRRLSADGGMVADLGLGQAVIAFTRGRHLDDLWPVALPTVAPARPPALAAAVAALAAVDRDRVAEVEDRTVARPLALYQSAGVGLAIASAFVVVALVTPTDTSADTGSATPIRWTALALAALSALTGLGQTVAALRRPMSRHLIVVVAVPSAGGAIDTIDATGQVRRWPAAHEVARDAPRDVPAVAWVRDGVAIAVVPVADQAPLPRATAAPP